MRSYVRPSPRSSQLLLKRSNLPRVSSRTAQAPEVRGTGEGGNPNGRRRRSRSKTSEAPVKVGALVVAFCALLTLTLLGPLMTYESEGVSGGGQLVRQLGYIAIALLAAYSVRATKVWRRLAVVPVPIIIAIVWCWLSVTWAFDPRISVRRVILLTMVLWSCFVIVRQLGYRSTIFLVRSSLVILLIANLIAVFYYPSIAIHNFDPLGEDSLKGDWRGIMGHKNMAGLVTALTVLLFTFDRNEMPRLVQLAVIGVASYFLWFTSSRTSVAVCGAALLIGFLYSWYRFKYRPLAIGAVVILTLVGAIVQNVYSDPFLRTLNDPAAFTGRTVIWAAMWNFYRNFPFFGAGYGSFWNIGPASPINQYGSDWLLNVYEGHNGYLDLLVTIGPVGLGLVVFAAIIMPIVRLMNWRQNRAQAGALLMSVMVFAIGHNATESSLFDRDSIGQVFLMINLALIWSVTAGGRGVAAGGADLFSWANRDEKHSDSSDG